MHKRYLIFLFLALALLFCTNAYAFSSADWMIDQASSDFHDWTIYDSSRFGSGTWNDEMAIYAEVYMFRLDGNKLCMQQAYAVANPLNEGDTIPWEIDTMAPVPLSDNAADLIAALPAEEIMDYGAGAVLNPDHLSGCADFLLQNGETLRQLIAYPDYLVGVAENTSGQRSLRIAPWNGASYDTPVASPMQDTDIYINEIHSWNTALEIMTDISEYYISYGADGLWRVGTINTGMGIYYISEDYLEDVTLWDNLMGNHHIFYGHPAFNLLLADINLAAFPSTLEEAVAQLDAKGYACTRRDDASMTDTPNGDVLANCYARLTGKVLAEQNGWTQLLIGSEENGMAGWFQTEDLAFGQDIHHVPCGFPSYDFSVLNDLPESEWSAAYIEYCWVIGQLPQGDYLIQANQDYVFTVPESFFPQLDVPVQLLYE